MFWASRRGASWSGWWGRRPSDIKFVCGVQNKHCQTADKLCRPVCESDGGLTVPRQSKNYASRNEILSPNRSVLYCPKYIYIIYIWKGKVQPTTNPEGPDGEYRCTSTFFLTSTWYGVRWSMPRPGRFTPGKDPVPILQEAGWAPNPVWTGAENLVPTGIRSLDCPVRSQSLYRLSYPGPIYIYIYI